MPKHAGIGDHNLPDWIPRPTNGFLASRDHQRIGIWQKACEDNCQITYNCKMSTNRNVSKDSEKPIGKSLTCSTIQGQQKKTRQTFPMSDNWETGGLFSDCIGFQRTGHRLRILHAHSKNHQCPNIAKNDLPHLAQQLPHILIDDVKKNRADEVANHCNSWQNLCIRKSQKIALKRLVP